MIKDKRGSRLSNKEDVLTRLKIHFKEVLNRPEPLMEEGELCEVKYENQWKLKEQQRRANKKQWIYLYLCINNNS